MEEEQNGTVIDEFSYIDESKIDAMQYCTIVLASLDVVLSSFFLFSLVMLRLRLPRQSIIASNLIVCTFFSGVFYLLNPVISKAHPGFPWHSRRQLCRFVGGASVFCFQAVGMWVTAISVYNAIVLYFPKAKRLQTLAFYSSLVIGWTFPSIVLAVALASDELQPTPSGCWLDFRNEVGRILLIHAPHLGCFLVIFTACLATYLKLHHLRKVGLSKESERILREYQLFSITLSLLASTWVFLFLVDLFTWTEINSLIFPFLLLHLITFFIQGCAVCLAYLFLHQIPSRWLAFLRGRRKEEKTTEEFSNSQKSTFHPSTTTTTTTRTPS